MIIAFLFHLSPPYNPLYEWSNRENLHISNSLSPPYIRRDGICHNEFIKMTRETNMGIIRKYPMRGKCTNCCCSFFPEHIRCFDNRPSGLYEIIDDDNFFSFWIPFFYRHDSPLSITNLATDNSRRIWKYIFEPLSSTIIRKYDHFVRMESQESCGCMEFCIDTIWIEE